jgi:A/G-specific adenine glycosylase
MLQQTRVAAVIPYYERFLVRFPSLDALAVAREEELLRAWAGLGYYSRARNLQKAAVQMAGVFPRDYEAIRALPGVGDYTAAAVASIAFDLPRAAVDGNVSRVIARLTNGLEDVRTEAEARLDPRRPGDFNQAMMELGATICLPRNPQCLLCPVAAMCEARAAGTESEIPPKKKYTVTRVQRRLLIIRRGDRMLFWQRPATDRKLAGFWELPESEQVPEAVVGAELGRFQHSITNFDNTFTLFEAEIRDKPKGMAWLPIGKPLQSVFSTSTRKALRMVLGASGV